jgi:FMN-binding protein
MRRIVLFVTGTLAGLILLFSYRTSLGGVRPQQGVAAAPGVVAPPAGSSGGGTGNDLTVNGPVADTAWGPVQVRVTISGGHITDVTAIEYPNGNSRDRVINSYALPQLRSQALQAQSANIDGVSGATVTSDGYIQSLQAALQIAHFG